RTDAAFRRQTTAHRKCLGGCPKASHLPPLPSLLPDSSLHSTHRLPDAEPFLLSSLLAPAEEPESCLPTPVVAFRSEPRATKGRKHQPAVPVVYLCTA